MATYCAIAYRGYTNEHQYIVVYAGPREAYLLKKAQVGSP